MLHRFMHIAKEMFWCAGAWFAATWRRRWQKQTLWSKVSTRPDLSSTLTSNRKRDFARRVGDTIEIQACTQSPYMDRADIAKILGIAPEQVRIIPTAVGGGFGSKLDLSVQPFVALAAWKLGRPVRMVYSRTESIVSTTKRHPARMRLRAGAHREMAN